MIRVIRQMLDKGLITIKGNTLMCCDDEVYDEIILAYVELGIECPYRLVIDDERLP